MKLEQILFEAYSIKEIKINVDEDTSLGLDKKELKIFEKKIFTKAI